MWIQVLGFSKEETPPEAKPEGGEDVIQSLSGRPSVTLYLFYFLYWAIATPVAQGM